MLIPKGGAARPLLSEAAPHLLKEFATGLNGTLDPETITTGSGRRLWWQCRHGCRTCGHQHQWQVGLWSQRKQTLCMHVIHGLRL